ncbi:unnamed protein product [Lasius platythorax]|uniref:Uncharacterized protein n=1 Tax=Lasius platythorax TaxID=488582 RepID=A0AAV2ND79_9HYME
MEMEKEEDKDLSSQEERTSRDRHSGDIVPVLAGSSSYDGPAVGSVASPTVEMAIASTSGGLVERAEGRDGDHISSLAGSSLLPELRLTRVDTSEVFQPPLPQRKPKAKKTRAVTRVPYGFPPASERAQSSVIELSDEETDTDFSIAKSSDLDRAANGDKPRKGRPPTTSEWVNLIKVKAEYIALRERELELDEIAYILDPNTLPKQTRTKLKLPNVDDLRKKIDDLFHLEVEKGAGKSLIFLDKLSDKSSGLSGRLVHQLRVEGRKLEASLAELRSRADLQQQVSRR